MRTLALAAELIRAGFVLAFTALCIISVLGIAGALAAAATRPWLP